MSTPADADTRIVTAGSSARLGRGDFTGTLRLLRLALRRDRVRIVVWALAVAALVGVSSSSVSSIYESRSEQLEYGRLVRGNAAMIIQSGPGYGLDDPSVGAILMNETAIWTIILVAILGITATVRYTRLEEETARAELVRSAPVGRHAGSAAALLALLVTQSAVAVAVLAVLLAGGFGAIGAVAFGSGLVAAGMAFSAVALVTAQLAASSRAASGMAMAALGVAFVTRAYGDVSAPWSSWLSPIHWTQAVRPFAGERWGALVLSVAFTVALLAVATRLSEHRDFGGGLLAQRPGRAEATRHLTSPLALAARLHRGAVTGWAVGTVTVGLFFGVIADEAQQMVEDNPEVADLLAQAGGGSVTDSYLASGLLFVGLIAGGFVVAAILRMRAEESAARVDPLLATPTGRLDWAFSHLIVAMASMVGLMLAGGSAVGIGAALVLGDASYITAMIAAAAVMSAGVSVLGGVAFALCAGAPRFAPAAWGVMVASAALGVLGQALDLPMWARNLSPFQHVPRLPAASFAPLPVALLAATTTALVALGAIALPRRDLGRI